MSVERQDKRPNFLFILVDDLGFSDIGCYGAEISTPNIDSLARDGTRLLQHHTASACSPTRAMIMSGTDAHLGGMGTLLEFKLKQPGYQRWNGKPGYEGYLTQEVATIPEILGDNGYCTLMSGKWHLGLRPEQGPWSRGFERAFSQLPGCSNHWGFEPTEEKFPAGGRPVHAEMGKKVDVKANTNEDPDGFYSSTTYTTRLLDYFQERSDEDKKKPFFAYYPFTAPHWPLQCTKAKRDKYKGKYDGGPFELRDQRLAALKKLGIVDESVVPHDVVPLQGYEWNTFDADRKKLSARAMECYAGMVEMIDDNIGRVLDYLKSTGEYDNTCIVFMSDNGAEGAAVEAYPALTERVKNVITKYYDNSYENLGAYNSFCWLGPLWAQASTAPSRLFKLFSSEGGILVPCVFKPPKDQFLPEYSQGGFNRSFTTCMDYMPTFLEMAGVSLPGLDSRKKMTFRGRQVHAPMGHSWVPYFKQHKSIPSSSPSPRGGTAETWSIYPADKPVGWELMSRAALRKGDWKIVHFEKDKTGAGEGDEGWELFDVQNDPGETKDLSEQHPEKKEELLRHWDEYVAECGIVWGPNAMADGKPKEEAPELWEDDTELQGTWMNAAHGVTPVFKTGIDAVAKEARAIAYN